MLRQHVRPTKAAVGDWTDILTRETRELTSAVLPLTEREFEISRSSQRCRRIVPALLTDDPTMDALIQSDPALQRKAQNAKKHRAGADEPTT
jgi:hypothetical protein